MNRIGKRTLSLFLALTMMFGLVCTTPVMAEDAGEIYISFATLDDEEGSAVTSVASGESFCLAVNFSNNPTVLEDSVQSYGLYISYDTGKMTALGAGEKGLGVGTYNEPESGVIILGWASTDGLYKSERGQKKVQASGTLVHIWFEAKADLTENDLQCFELLNKYDNIEAKISGINNKQFAIIQTPALSVAVKSGAKIYTSSTPEEIAGLIDVTYIDATGTPSAVAASDVKVTLPAGGLKAGTNTLTATANGVNCTFEATVLEDSLTGIEIDHAPTKVDYTAFENFDPAGMVVTATYASGKTADVTASCTFAPSSALEVTDTQVTVTYQGQTVNQAITVSSKSITGAEITLDTIPTYNGAEQSVTITSVTVDGRTLDSGDYDITSGSSATDVASTTLVITGKGNYKETASLDWQLEKAALTLPSASVDAKTYDGDKTATINPGTLNGIKNSDEVSVKETSINGTFENEFVGTGKTVTTTEEFTLTGVKAGNYTLTQPSGLTGNITTATQRITAEDKTIVKNGVGRDISGWATSNATGATITYTLVGTPAGITLTSGNILTAENADSTVESFTIEVTSGAVDVNKDGTPEYSAATEKTFTVEVTDKYDAGVSIKDAPTSKTYGNADFDITAEKTCPDDTNGVWSWTSSDPAVLEIVSGADTSTVTVKVKKADATGATLTVSYTGDNYYDTAAATIKVDPKTLTAADLEFVDTTITKPYDGDTSSTATVKVLDSAKVNDGDTLPTVSGSAVYNSADVASATKVTFTTTESTSANYKVPAGLIKEQAATITKVNSSVTAAPTAKSGLKYTGSAQNLVDAGTASGGTMQYALSVDGNYSADIPTGTNAVSYTVYYKVVGDGNHNDTAAAEPISVTIDKADPTVTLPTGKTGLKYTGSAQVLITAGTTNGGEMQYKVGDGAYSTTIPTGTDATDYTVYYKVVGNDNYNDVAEASLTITIGKGTLGGSNASRSIRFTNTGVQTYTAADFGLTDIAGTFAAKGSVTDSGKVLATGYPKYEDGAIKVQLTSGLSTAGQTVTIPVTFTPTNPNWAAKDYELTITLISKKNVDSSITFENGELTYNGSVQTYETATISDVSGGTWTYTYTAGTGTLEGGKPKTVGTYSVKAVYEDADNLGEKTVTLTIKPKEIAIPAADTTVYTYTGSAQTYQIAASSDYNVSGNTQTDANETGYKVTVSLADAANNVWEDGTTADKTYTFIIKKATPTGQPSYTKITTSGKTLADAALDMGTITIPGTIQWVDAEGKPLAETTAVTANTAYRWVFTPDDTANYETLTGSITPYVVHSSSGGSGSSSYSITVESDKNGTVTVSPKSARKGTTVTITVKPDEGFELDTLRVYDKDGNKIKVTEGKNGKYTFTMPASKVTVKAAFEEIESAWPFVDVAEDFWARDAIAWAYENGYMNGNSASTFNPGGSVTRQQLWMILARLSGERPASMAEAKVWAVENGISDGSNPGNAVSRQQMVTILYRYAHLMGYKTSGSAALDIFPDSAKVAPYAQDAMAWSVANGIVGGTTQGTLNPGGTANRAQFATILQRFCKNIVED